MTNSWNIAYLKYFIVYIIVAIVDKVVYKNIWQCAALIIMHTGTHTTLRLLAVNTFANDAPAM